MYQTHEQFLGWLDARVRSVLKGVDAFRIGVMVGSGHGDHYARGFALAADLKERHPDSHVTVITRVTGNMVECDLAHAYMTARVGYYQQPAVNAHIMTQQIPRGAMIRKLSEHFDLLFDAYPYAPQSYGDRALPIPGCYRILHDGYPKDCARLMDSGESQWDILSNSTGVGTPASLISKLFPAYELAPDPTAEECPPPLTPADLLSHGGKDNWDRCKMHGERYVIVHNQAGMGGNVKEAPPELWAAIIEHLTALNIKCVQVGGAKDTELPGAIDRRGFRLPLTCKLIRDSIGVVAIEGFLPYLAHACGAPCVTLFGPTPRPVFGFPKHKSLIRIVDKGNGQMGVPCATPCFWGGDGVCFARTWSLNCARGPRHPAFDRNNVGKRLYCLNFPEPQTAAAEIGEYLLENEKGKKQ